MCLGQAAIDLPVDPELFHEAVQFREAVADGEMYHVADARSVLVFAKSDDVEVAAGVDADRAAPGGAAGHPSEPAGIESGECAVNSETADLEVSAGVRSFFRLASNFA